VHIKICGLTNPDDAFAALDAGADMLGFNFYSESPRYIAPTDCSRIVSAVRNRQSEIAMIGIFVNQPSRFVAEILDLCGLDAAQLSGDEPPHLITRLWGRAYKAIRSRSIEEAEQDALRFTPLASGEPALLVDAVHAQLYGGTGQVADWAVARYLSARCAVLLAGGLTPENVAEAIRAVEPWGVDVASGVEAAPGKKDHRKMIDFVKAARSAVAQLA